MTQAQGGHAAVREQRVCGAGGDVVEEESVCGVGGDVVEEEWKEHEVRAVLAMAELGRRIRLHPDRRVDVTSNAGRKAAHQLLVCVDIAARALKVRLAPDAYRQRVPPKLLAQWTDTGSRYSIQVLVASVLHWRDFNVNNLVFCLSDEAQRLSLELCCRWADIGFLTRDLLGGLPQGDPLALPRSTVVAMLEAFDRASAAFECKFFSEMQAMQTEALNPLAPLALATERAYSLSRIRESVERAAQAQALADDTEYQRQRRLLVKTIWRLNQVVNRKSDGRRFTVQTLRACEAVVEQCKAGQLGLHDHTQSPSLAIATDALEAFERLCAYFCQVKDCMDRVDPTLRNNKGLVDRLARWELTWGRVSDYVEDPSGRRALETLMAGIHKAQGRSPELVQMCSECSAELFVVLPRLVWLGFLAKPDDVAPVLHRQLRHHFNEAPGAEGESDLRHGDELQKFLEEHGRVLDAIAQAVAGELLVGDPEIQARVLAIGPEEARRELASELLSDSAVLGTGGDWNIYASILLPGPKGLEARHACRTFMRRLEGWSTELHRRCPCDWNRFANLVVRCMNNTLCQADTTEAEDFQL